MTEKMQYKPGDKVIISKNLRKSQTQTRFTVVSSMYDMQGKVYEINTVGTNNSVTIFYGGSGRSYRFDLTDIMPVGLDSSKIFLKEKKKYTFDPGLLHL